MSQTEQDVVLPFSALDERRRSSMGTSMRRVASATPRNQTAPQPELTTIGDEKSEVIKAGVRCSKAMLIGTAALAIAVVLATMVPLFYNQIAAREEYGGPQNSAEPDVTRRVQDLSRNTEQRMQQLQTEVDSLKEQFSKLQKPSSSTAKADPNPAPPQPSPEVTKFRSVQPVEPGTDPVPPPKLPQPINPREVVAAHLAYLSHRLGRTLALDDDGMTTIILQGWTVTLQVPERGAEFFVYSTVAKFTGLPEQEQAAVLQQILLDHPEIVSTRLTVDPVSEDVIFTHAVSVESARAATPAQFAGEVKSFVSNSKALSEDFSAAMSGQQHQPGVRSAAPKDTQLSELGLDPAPTEQVRGVATHPRPAPVNPQAVLTMHLAALSQLLGETLEFDSNGELSFNIQGTRVTLRAPTRGNEYWVSAPVARFNSEEEARQNAIISQAVAQVSAVTVEEVGVKPSNAVIYTRTADVQQARQASFEQFRAGLVAFVGTAKQLSAALQSAIDGP